MVWELTWYCCTSTFFFLFILSFHRLNRHRVVPLRWPVLGMLPGLLANAHRLHDFLTSLLGDSGGTFMFRGPWFMGLDFMITCDPANAKHMYNARFTDYPKGDEFSEIFDILGKGILTVDGDMWSKQRKMAVAHMCTHNFRSSLAENSRDKVQKALLPILDRMTGLDRVFDLQDVMKRFAMDVTSRQVLGKDPGSLAHDFPDVPFAKAVEDAEEVLLYRHVVPMVWWKLLRWLQLGEEKKMTMSMNAIDCYIAGCIEEKRNEAARRLESMKIEESRDLLTSYMYHSLKDDINIGLDRDQEINNYFTSDNFLRDTLLTFLSAGTDTIASGLSWFFWLVTKSPHVEKKILEELRELLRPKLEEEVPAAGRQQCHVIFDTDETDGLVYLHAALCETLRLFPPVPFNHKVALKDDVLPSGHRVRRGTKVLFSTYSTGRMKIFWGEDCLEFKPERWINSSDGQLKYVHSHEFLAFHSGPKSCLGKNMAMTQMKVAAAAIIYNFHVELEEDCRVQPKLSIVMGMKNGLMVKIRKRQAH